MRRRLRPWAEARVPDSPVLPAHRPAGSHRGKTRWREQVSTLKGITAGRQRRRTRWGIQRSRTTGLVNRLRCLRLCGTTLASLRAMRHTKSQ